MQVLVRVSLWLGPHPLCRCGLGDRAMFSTLASPSPDVSHVRPNDLQLVLRHSGLPGATPGNDRHYNKNRYHVVLARGRGAKWGPLPMAHLHTEPGRGR